MWSLDVTFTWFEFVLDTMTKYDQQNNNNKTREVGLHQTKQCLRRKWSGWWKVSPQDGESFWKLETDDLDLSSDFHCCLTLVHEDLIPVLMDVAPHASCSLLHCWLCWDICTPFPLLGLGLQFLHWLALQVFMVCLWCLLQCSYWLPAWGYSSLHCGFPFMGPAFHFVTVR